MQPSNNHLQTQNTAPTPLVTPVKKHSLAARGLDDITNLGKASVATAEELNIKGESFLNLVRKKGLDETQQLNLCLQALNAFHKAADMGYVRAQATLGIMYADILWGDLHDKEKSVYWWRKAAEQGDSDSQCTLGSLYERGYGVAQDNVQAVQWYRKAADQGDEFGQYHLGIMYANGSGVAQDNKQSFDLFVKSAEHGLDEAQFMLGCIFENGDLVAQDNQQATYWYAKAAEQDHEMAKKSLTHLEQEIKDKNNELS